MTRRASKGDYDALVFSAEPPPVEQAVKLFVGRAEALRRADRTLSSSADVGGRRARKAPKMPWVIHGESRSGKSHFARCLWARRRTGAKRLKLGPIGARSQGDALAVMWRVFGEFRDEFYAFYNGDLYAADLQQQPLGRQTEELIAAMNRFLGPGGEEPVTLTFATTRSEESALEGGASAVAFAGKHTTRLVEGGATTVQLRPPTPQSLAELCGVITDTLCRAGLVDHVLVLVDDVDLLLPYRGPDETGRGQGSMLASALWALHQGPCIDVVVTARTWYANARKEFRELMDLAREPELDPEALTRIHDLRMKHYVGRRNVPRQFLQPPALTELAGMVKGLPGLFLDHLDIAFDQFKREDGWEPRDLEWLLDVFKRLWLDFRRLHPDAAGAIETAIREERDVLDVAAGNPIASTRVDAVFAHQSHDRDTHYYIAPILQRILAADVTGGTADA